MTSANFHGGNHGTQIGYNYGSVTTQSRAYSNEEVGRICIQKLRCPDSLIVKNRLKETKDRLRRESFEWVLQDPQYRSWRNGNDVCLLWIKGGAGKGKTMMSIGLIEALSQQQDETAVVAYFFCQNANSELNTLESVIKGLILRLVNQRGQLKELLRNRLWDPTKSECFNKDVSSWRALWDILWEMLDRCGCPRVYIIVDALDECQDSGMADFLSLIVRNGLDQPAKLKWLLTSRPLEAAERILLAGHEQMQVSLELNSDHISQSVQAYISYKVDELSLRNRYGQTLGRILKTELFEKAEGTFLWVSLVCKRLEDVCADEALSTIQDLPPGLHPFYDRILNQLREGHPDDVFSHIRLLKAMMLVYRPLRIEEVPSVTGLSRGDDTIKLIVNHCASFVRIQENNIEFVHQSARDYLAEENGLAILNSHGRFEHYNIVLSCLSYLSEQLKINLLNVPPNTTSEFANSLISEKQNIMVSSLDYATTFWVQHLQKVPPKALAQNHSIDEGPVGSFLQDKLLEWLECFSLLDRLPKALDSINALQDIAKEDSLTLALMQDAARFLQRHYVNIARWPLQIYSSALIFSPETSIVRKRNLHKIPGYIKTYPKTENTWTSLIQTLSISSSVVAFSLDRKQIVSAEGTSLSRHHTIKIWDSTTGDLQKTLEGHSDQVLSLAFSPDGKQIASGSRRENVKLWDITTGNLQKTLKGHLDRVMTVAFSPDGKQIASGSHDCTVKLWDSITGDLQKTLEGHSDPILNLAFSPDGKQIASGSHDSTVKLWDSVTGDLQKTLEGHSRSILTLSFSPDGKQIASGSHDYTVKLWDSTTGDLQKTLKDHSHIVRSVAFSPDGKQIASGSDDLTIKLWGSTGEAQNTLKGHLEAVISIAFSLDGKQILSGSFDRTIKRWDSTRRDQKTLESHSSAVRAIVFSPDSKQIASGSDDHTIKLWDSITGDLQKTLEGHSDQVNSLAFHGKQIASGSNDTTVKLWDSETGNLQKTLRTFHSNESSLAVAFSPDGKQIASGHFPETIILWDITTGDLQKTFKGPPGIGRVSAVAFSPDGKQIASGHSPQTIILWGITKSQKSPKLLGLRLSSSLLKLRSGRKIQASKPPVLNLKFSADSLYLITDTEQIRLQDTAIEEHNKSPYSSIQSFFLKDQWICYGVMPFLRLSPDMQRLVACHDTQDDQVAIGLNNGQVLSFGFDRSTLHSMLVTGHVPLKN